jgi:hypothetical protein
LQWKTDVDYLPMAKPDAINHLKIRHGYASNYLMLAIGSFHLERLTLVYLITMVSLFKICEIGG